MIAILPTILDLGVLDTIVSSDLVNIGWSSSMSKVLLSLCIERYEISINKKFGVNGELELFRWSRYLGATHCFLKSCPLEHDTLIYCGNSSI